MMACFAAAARLLGPAHPIGRNRRGAVVLFAHREDGE